MKIKKINNIQFMTDANRVATGEKRNGEDVYRYIPNFAEMFRNASCPEEKEAIRDVMKMFGEGLLDGFAFEVVFMVYAEHWNCLEGKFDGMKWQMFQHPWYVEGWGTGEHVCKDLVIREIEHMVEAC